MLHFAARTKSLQDAKVCLDLGFSLLEITLPCPNGRDEEKNWLELKNQGKASFLAHGPQEGDPRDPERLNREYAPKLLEAVEAAARLQCPWLTVHLWLDHRFLPPDVIDKKIGLLKKISDKGTEAGVRISIENLSETAADMSPALSRVESLGLTLDLGHAELMQKENTSFGFIENCFDRIQHLHMHDNHGGSSPKDDLHLPPGSGRVPFSKILKLLKEKKYDGTATLELKPDEILQARLWLTGVWDSA